MSLYSPAVRDISMIAASLNPSIDVSTASFISAHGVSLTPKVYSRFSHGLFSDSGDDTEEYFIHSCELTCNPRLIKALRRLSSAGTTPFILPEPSPHQE